MSDPQNPASERRRADRTSPPSAAPLLPDLPTLRAWYAGGSRDDHKLLQFCCAMLAYQKQQRQERLGSAAWDRLWCQATGASVVAVDARETLLTLARQLPDPQEARGSALGRSRLVIVARLPPLERAVLFAYGRQGALAAQRGERSFFLSPPALQSLCKEAAARPTPAARIALLRERLEVSADLEEDPPDPAAPADAQEMHDPPPGWRFPLNLEEGTAAFERAHADLRARLATGADIAAEADAFSRSSQIVAELDQHNRALLQRSTTAASPVPSDPRPPRARAPYLIGELDYALPVAYPFNRPIDDLDPFERCTSEIIVIAGELVGRCAALLEGRRQPGLAVAYLLQLRTCRAAARFTSAADDILPLIEAAAAQGLQDLQARDPAAAAAERPPQMPLPCDFSSGIPADLYPLSYVPVLVRDPLCDPAPERLEPDCWRILGLYEALNERMEPWLDQRDDGAAADRTLLAQLDQGLRQAKHMSYRVRSEFTAGSALGQKEEEAQQTAVARLDSAFLATLPEPNLVILGSDRPVPLYTKVGVDGQGRHVALSLYEPLMVLALGGWGWGKSHLGRLIAESLHLSLPGINRLQRGLLSATFEVSHRLGRGRRQMLRGFFPNTDQAQLAQLRFYFSCDRSNAAFRRGILRCMPHALQELRRELAMYIERGLQIEPIELGPQNLGQLGYESLMGAAFRRGADRPAYADHLSWLIGEHGPDLTPEMLMAEVASADAFARVRGQVMAQLKPLLGLVRPGADLRDDLAQGCPLFYLLESADVPVSFLLGLLVALMNGLSMPTGDPERDRMLWLFCDELSKIMELPMVGHQLLLLAQEIRHRPVSYFFGGQRATNLPKGFLGLVSVLFEFHLSSAEEHELLRSLSWMRQVNYGMNVALGRGQALAGAVLATAAEYRQSAQGLWLRPSMIEAGGETVHAG